MNWQQRDNLTKIRKHEILANTQKFLKKIVNSISIKARTQKLKAWDRNKE